MRILGKMLGNKVSLNVKENKKKTQKVVTFNVEEKMVKGKTLAILTHPKESNLVNVKNLGIFKSNVPIFRENKEKSIMPLFR